MKIKGTLKKSFRSKDGLLWKKSPINCSWDGKSATTKLNKQTIQITDCKSTFESAKNDCIFVVEVIKEKRKANKDDRALRNQEE